MHRMSRLHLGGLFIVVALAVTSLAAVSPVAAAGPITSISLSPTSATLTADQSQVFKVIASDKDGVTTDVTNGATLSTTDPLGVLALGFTYEAGKAGTWKINASYQSFTAEATVTVTAGTLNEISINPNSAPEYVNLNAKRRFSTQLFDQKDNVITGQAVIWSVIGDLGTIDDDGIFTANKLGSGKIQATVGTITGQINLTVKAAPVTNANANANTNAAVNGNNNTNTANANVNAAVNGEVNVNESTNNNSNTNNSVTTTVNDGQCTTLKPWLWTVILIIFLLAVAILYGLVPMSKIWPAGVALAAAVGLVIVQRQWGCNGLSWWPWILILGTIALTILALRQLPPKQNPTP